MSKTLDENIIDSIKGAAWQLKKPEAKEEMVNKLTKLIMEGLATTNKEWVEEHEDYIKGIADTILRWPDIDNIRKQALTISKRIPGQHSYFNKVFFVLRNSLDKVKKSSVVKENYEEYTDYEARKQEEGIKEWHVRVHTAVENKLGRKLSTDEKKKLDDAVDDGKWANYFDKSDNQAAINKFAQIQDVIKEEIFNY